MAYPSNKRKPPGFPAQAALVLRKNYLPHLAVTFSNVVEPVSTTDNATLASLELNSKVPESSTVIVVRGGMYALTTTVWENVVLPAYRREEILSNSTISKLMDIVFLIHMFVSPLKTFIQSG